MLENLCAQNVAACEKQGKQCELSDHWKSIKILFFKKKSLGDDAKKAKRLTEYKLWQKILHPTK